MRAIRQEIQRLERLASPQRLMVAKGVNVSYEFHSTQINLFDNLSEKDFNFYRIQNQIPAESIYREFPQKPGMLGMLQDDPNESYGLETEPHITLLYGLVNEADYFNIRKDVQATGGINITIGEISSFRRPDKPYDVLKLSIESQDLKNLHYKLAEKYENKQNFPDYKAHLTLAYVQKGTCVELEGPCAWTGTIIPVKCAVFSHKEGYKLPLPLC